MNISDKIEKIVAEQYGYTTPVFGEQKSTADDNFFVSNNTGTGTSEVGNGYFYFYNLGDSSKYSFGTNHRVHRDNNGTLAMSFGSLVLPQASTVDGIRIYVPTSGNLNATVSLYGIAES